MTAKKAAAPAKKAAAATKASKAPARNAASAKKTPAKQAAAKKAPANNAAAKKAPANNAASKKAPAKKAPAKKAPANKAVAAAKSSAAKTRATKAPAKQAVAAQKAPAKKAVVKKAAAAKATKKAAPVVKKKSPYGVKFLNAQEKLLQHERATYFRQFESLRAEADALVADFESGDVQFDEESGEGDTINIERERDLALSEQARQAVEEIDHALGKIAAGTYGLCEVSGDPIPPERLEAIPWAREKVEYKTGGFNRR